MDKILASIDAEIAHLKQARAVLAGDGAKKTTKLATPKKHKMSAAARKKIADAQRRRWAKQKAAK
jgi:methylase of polypeptide subunit release factors